MRTPRSTESSYWNVSCGVRFIRSSRAIRPWSTPCAASSPASVCSRFFSEPRTLTKTCAWRRSDDVSTPVTVTKPIRGSRGSPTASARPSCTAALTRRIRSLTGGHPLPLDTDQLVLLSVQVANRFFEQLSRLAVLAGNTGHGQPAPLPEAVVVDLGHGCPEAVLQLRLRRLYLPPLALQRARFREMQVHRQDADVAGAHGGLGLGGCGARRLGRRRAEVGALDLPGLEDLEHV